MKKNYTIALRVFVLLVVISITHTAAKILGSLGLISDLFVVLGAYQVWLNVKSPAARQNLIKQFKDYTNLDDISELLADKTEEVKAKVEEAGYPLPTNFRSPFNEEDISDYLGIVKGRKNTPEKDFEGIISEEQRLSTLLSEEEQAKENLPEERPVIKPVNNEEYFSDGGGI